MPLKIRAFITFDTIENVSQDRKIFCNMFLYDIITLFIRELCKVTPIGIPNRL
jgi:hypothetical protein